MKQLITDDTRTVVIVSHDTKAIKALCTKVLWINDGELMAFGDPQNIIAQYETYMNG